MTAINYYFNHEHPLRPFTGSDYANKDSFSPDNALRVEPETQPGFWPCEQDGAWVLIPDHRGTKVYDTATAQESEIKELGERPDGVTTIAPDVEFPKWNGKKWVTDTDAQHAADVEDAEQMKTALLAKAHEKISLWQTELQLGIISDEDKESLIGWVQYIKAVQAIDTSPAPNINWPAKPE